MKNQKGSSSFLVVVSVIVLFCVALGSYYFLIPHTETTETSSPLQTSTPIPMSKEEFNELNAPVWVDVQAIVTSVNLYYNYTKRLPKDLNETFTLEELKDIKVKNNPFTHNPYVYIPREDGRGFTVIGIQSDGTEYKQEASFDN